MACNSFPHRSLSFKIPSGVLAFPPREIALSYDVQIKLLWQPIYFLGDSWQADPVEQTGTEMAVAHLL
jgi:hypothetical protein